MLNSQSILAKAVRGELVPQDPNEEPASELLKRIKAEREITQKESTKGRKTKKIKKAATKSDKISDVDSVEASDTKPPSVKSAINKKIQKNKTDII